MFHLESLLVQPHLRGKGIGQALHRQFRALARRRWPWIKFASGEVTSAGALRLLAHVYGKPLYIADYIRTFSLEEALAILPPVGFTDEHGCVECEGWQLWVNVWIGRGAPPKEHPWSDR